MEQQQISAKKQKAMERVKRANAELAKVLRVLRTAVVCRGQPRGDTTFPLRCYRTYPYVYFALGKENAKIWRKDLADTINAVNAKIGMTDKFWEYRSFKEQGLDIIPQIHLGEKASAMERAGIKTIRGDINRDIIARNAIINGLQSAFQSAL